MAAMGGQHYAEEYVNKIVQEVNRLYRDYTVLPFVRYFVEKSIRPIVYDLEREAFDRGRKYAIDTVNTKLNNKEKDIEEKDKSVELQNTNELISKISAGMSEIGG